MYTHGSAWVLRGYGARCWRLLARRVGILAAEQQHRFSSPRLQGHVPHVRALLNGFILGPQCRLFLVLVL